MKTHHFVENILFVLAFVYDKHVPFALIMYILALIVWVYESMAYIFNFLSRRSDLFPGYLVS